MLHVLGRADDVIISGGENVHPAQVEAVLAATPGVRAAAAFGVPDPRWGQIVAAAIAVEPTFDRGRRRSRAGTRSCRRTRARAASPRRRAPRLPSGKLDRRALAAAADLADRVRVI